MIPTIFVKVIMSFGASKITIEDEDNKDFVEPLTQEDFNKFTITSPTEITYQMYLNSYDNILLQSTLKIIRKKRDIDLQSSDFLMTIDYSAKLSNKNDWISYRESLRNFPGNISTLIWIAPNEGIDYNAMGYPQKPSTIFT